MLRNLSSQALIIGICTGLIDAAIVRFGANEVAYIPETIWIAVPLVWLVFLCLVGLIFSIPALQRFSAPALILAGPGLLLLSRGGPRIKQFFDISVISAVAICLVILAGLVPLASRLLVRLSLGRRKAAILMFPVFVLAIANLSVDQAPAAEARRGAADGQRLNVVLIFLDTVRYDDMDHMPNLRRFASSSIVFDSAWAPAAWTLPSHFAVFTGVDPWLVKFDPHWQRFEYRQSTLAERFGHRGYTTAGIFANPLLNPGTQLTRGFQRLRYSQDCAGCRSGLASLLYHLYWYTGWNGGLCGWMSASEVTSRATHFITRAERPYFLVLNFMDAHEPYWRESSCDTEPLRIYTWSDSLAFARTVRGTRLPKDVAVRIRAQHEAAVRCMDRALGPLLGRLSREVDDRRTIVAIVSDHGEQFGEHGLVRHANSLYSQLLHVPLVIKIPGEQPRHVAEPVSISDLHGTLLGADLEQRNSAGLFSNNRRPVIATLFPGSGSSVVDAQYHFLRLAGGREEFYDYHADPAETRPLPVSGDALVSLRSALPRQANPGSRNENPFGGVGYLQY